MSKFPATLLGIMIVVGLAVNAVAAENGAQEAAREKAKSPPRDAFQDAMVSAILHFAAEGELGHLRTVLEKYPQLVDARRGIDKGARKPVRTDAFAAIHFAAEQGEPEVIEYLVTHGADVNDICYGGWTPLHLAAWSGQLSAVEMLVKHGAKTDAKTEAIAEHDAVPPSSRDGKPYHFSAVPARTPLQLAREQNHREVVEFLKDKPH